MSYRETVRSVRAFMGWHHIPAFETDYAEPEKSNNPWKDKNPRKPTRISVAMPPDDWLCQKLERLNLTVAEGYPSRSQDSAGLKRDQFVKVPKSQGKWYKMHLLKPEEPHRPGRSVFSWRNSEAKVNSQFPRITRTSVYPSTGPPSRPIAQESLQRWERAAREDSYIINHVAGFRRCSTELQEKMSQNIALLCSRLNKGKTSKDITNALNDLHDLMAFHQKVSVAMGTSLQHLAESLFVNMSNLILLRRDAYLDFVKQGVKQDTMNLLRNAPLFGYGLFPDAAIMTAEQDIQKFDASSVAQRPGPGASQPTSRKSSHRYKPYDRKDRKPVAYLTSLACSSNNNPGVSLVEIVPEGVDVDGVLTLVFPRCSLTNNTNDSYLVGPTYSHVNQVQVDPQCQDKVMSESQTLESYQTLTSSVCTKTLNLQDVCCPAAFHAPSVNLRGPPQKKGVSPARYQSKIKHVKGVCKSMLFCPFCSQCPQCCFRTECRRKVAKILASLAKHECKSSRSLSPQGGLHSSLQAETPFGQVPLGSKWLRQSNKESGFKRGLPKSHEKVGSRKSGCQVFPGLLQPSLSGSETKQEVEANLGSESVKCIPQHRHFQNGNPRDNPVILTGRGVGHVAGLQRHILPHPNCPKVKEVSQVLSVPTNLPVHSSPLPFGHCSTGVHQGGQEGEAYGSREGYPDPPVHRRLVTESPFPGNLPTSYPDPLGPLPTIRVGSQHDQIGVSSQIGLQFCRLPVQPGDRSSATHIGPVGSSPGKVEIYKGPKQLYGQTIHVSNRPSHSYRKTSVFRPASHETHSVAIEEALAHPRSFRKGDPYSSVTPPTFRLVARRVQCAERSAVAPSSARSSAVYRRLKRRLGHTLRGLHCKRCLVVHRKSPSYKCSGTESSLGPAKFRASVQGPDCSCCNRQHNSGLLHKQTGGYEVRLSLCPPMETSVLVPSQRDSFEGKAHSRSLECDSGQAFQAQSSDPNRVVSLPTGVQSLVFQMGPTASGFVCDPVQSQTSPVCVTGARSGSLGSRCLESTLGTFEGVRLSSSLPDPPSNLKVKGSGLSQDDPHCPGLAEHALVLGPGESIPSDCLF